MLEVDKVVFQRERLAYELTDGTTIKLSWFNPQRVTKELFSEGQVVTFLPQDVVTPSADFDSVYKNATQHYTDDRERVANSNTVTYRGFISKAIHIPNEITKETPTEMVRLALANENLNTEAFVYLFSKCLSIN